MPDGELSALICVDNPAQSFDYQCLSSVAISFSEVLQTKKYYEDKLKTEAETSAKNASQKFYGALSHNAVCVFSANLTKNKVQREAEIALDENPAFSKLIGEYSEKPTTNIPKTFQGLSFTKT